MEIRITTLAESTAEMGYLAGEFGGDLREQLRVEMDVAFQVRPG